MKRLTHTLGTLLIGLLIFGSMDLAAQGKGKGKGKAKVQAKKEAAMLKKDENKARAEAWKAEIATIKADSNLTEEERDELIATKRAEINAARIAEHDVLRGEKSKMKAKRDSIKSIVQAIEEDPGLTEEEKEERIKEIRMASKAERDAARDAKGKGKKMHKDDEPIRGKSSGKNGKGKKLKTESTDKELENDDDHARAKKNKKPKRELSKNQKNRAKKGLANAEASLEKTYRKGKISEEMYNERLTRIRMIREKIEL